MGHCVYPSYLSCCCLVICYVSLTRSSGIKNISVDLKSQLVHIEGSAAPSAIVAAIQDTGRDAILRGSGKTDWAGVCILETHSTNVSDPVRGLIRMVQVAPQTSIIDLTIKGLSPGTYNITVRQRGLIIEGAGSTGLIWGYLEANKRVKESRGYWGTVNVDQSGTGSAFTSQPVHLDDIFGKSIVVSTAQEEDNQEVNAKTFEAVHNVFRNSREDPNTLVGVIARSAGVWDNDKTVCSCSGKTVWEERTEQVGKGML